MSNRFRSVLPIASVLGVLALLLADLGFLFASTYYEFETADPTSPASDDDED